MFYSSPVYYFKLKQTNGSQDMINCAFKILNENFINHDVIDNFLNNVNSLKMSSQLFSNPDVTFLNSFVGQENLKILDNQYLNDSLDEINNIIRNNYENNMDDILNGNISLIGEEFGVFTDIFFEKDNISIEEMQKYEDLKSKYNYSITNFKTNYTYRQWKAMLDVHNWTQTDLVDMLKNFTDGLVDSARIEDIKNSFIFQTEKVFNDEYLKRNNKSGKNINGCNDGKNSYIKLSIALQKGLDYIKGTISHETTHQLSANNNDMGIMDYKNNKWYKGLNESTTEYLSQRMLGTDNWYRTGYGYGVEAMAYLVDNNIMTLEELKKAYYTNDKYFIWNRILNLSAFSNPFKTAFSKVTLSDKITENFEIVIDSENYTEDQRKNALFEIQKDIDKLKKVAAIRKRFKK